VLVMKLSLISEDKDLVHVRSEGEIGTDELIGDAEPMASLLAPLGGFRRKVLLNLERTTIIYTPGMSWLLTCHKRFIQGGGQLVLHSIPPLVEESLTFLSLQKILHLAADAAAARALALKERQ
jgi:hypothetical protein